MSENVYADYKYKRPKVRKKKNVLFLSFVIFLGISIFAVSLTAFLGGKKPVTVKTELPGIEFQAIGARGFSTKAKALEQARDIREKGGAGYVDIDSEWFVLEEIGGGELSFSAKSIEVNLVSLEHKDVFNSIIISFTENTNELKRLLARPAKEVSALALEMYNELATKVLQFDEFQVNATSAMYREVLVASHKQLLALFMLSAEKNADNISSATKYCICAISFAYIELLTSLQPQ